MLIDKHAPEDVFAACLNWQRRLIPFCTPDRLLEMSVVSAGRTGSGDALPLHVGARAAFHAGGSDPAHADL